LGADATVTEFSNEAVSAMREGLGVQAIKFDYNSDDLTQCVDKEFDVILIEYSLNFCNDLERFAREAFQVVRPGGIIYATIVSPTLGTSLRWEFDEYTYNNLYVPESVALAFRRAGFVEVERGADGEYPYTQGGGWSGLWGAMRRFWANYYRRKIRRTATLNRELVQKNRFVVFARP
jgi:SAM-dependent methyltransferase